MIFTLHTPGERPVGAVLAGTPAPATDGVRVEVTGGFRLRCTAGNVVVDPATGGSLRAWGRDGSPLGQASWPAELAAYPARPVLAFTISNGTAVDLEVWVEWLGVYTTVPAGGTLPAAWVGEPLGAGPDPWREVCEISYRPGVLQLWETSTCALMVGTPDGSTLETFGAHGQVPAALRGWTDHLLTALKAVGACGQEGS